MDAAGDDVLVTDLDGTVVDVRRDHVLAAIDRVGERLGCAFDEREAVRLWYGTDGLRRQILSAHEIDVTEFWRTYEAIRTPDDRVAATYLYDDAARLGELDRPLGIVTHCPERVTTRVLAALDIADWFDTVVCCHEGLGWKPDPAPVERALAELGVGSDSEGVLTGDGAGDIGAAWNAGLEGVHVARHDPAVRGQCVRADRRVQTFTELFP
jgi:phosphoglycolate phosphatase